MHPVLRLVKDDGGRGLEHLVGDLHGLPSELLAHLFPHLGLVVMVGGQAVHEPALGPGVVHQGLCHLIGRQGGNALLPDLHRLPHGDPNVRVQHVGVLDSFHGVFDELQHRAGLGGET